ncbi:pyruvate kinase [Pseudomonadota bacterium]
MPIRALIEKKEAALRWRRTKIIATLGPASDDPITIEKLIRTGVNAFRINMSHGDHETHRAVVKQVREVSQLCNQHIAILMDLCGPKIRVGTFEHGEIQLDDNSDVIVTCRDVIGHDGLIPSQYQRLNHDIENGERILLDDGNMELKALSVVGTEIHCQVVHGGILKNNKGMNLPDSSLTTSSFTDKDKRDAKLAIELDADFLALSFVRSHEDVLQLKTFIEQHTEANIGIISKIEKPEAVSNIEAILEHSYGIMVARGDLGIEIPAERVPLLQQELIQLAREYNRPVIVATQMLESMITQSRPTRAEVGDVANAALSATDAVMLSGETAAGKHPVMAVETMDRVLREIENHQWHQNSFGTITQSTTIHEGIMPIREAVASATIDLAQNLKLQGIIIPTRTGTTARIISASRPSAPCIGVCSDAIITRQLALSWGVVPVLVEEPDTHNWRSLCELINDQVKLTQTGHTVLLVSGFNEDPALNEPVMKILSI